MTDADTQAAIDALAYRIRQRDTAMNDGEDYADAEPFAAEFLLKLRAQGWRLTEAKAMPGPHTPGAGRPKDPEVADLLAKTRADLAAKDAEFKAAHRNPLDGAA